MFKAIALSGAISLSGIWAWCHPTPKVNICHDTENGYVAISIAKDAKWGESDYAYNGPVDEKGKPNEASTEWCQEHLPPTEPTPPQDPPVVTPPVETPPATPAVKTPTVLPKTGGSF